MIETPSYDKYVFPEPWADLRGDEPGLDKRRSTMVGELMSELGPVRSRQVVADGVEAVAMFTDHDEVLFRLGTGAFWMVHLTFAGKYDAGVRVRTISCWAETAAVIEAMSPHR
ncbi:MAG: hypothetical protein ACR2IP_13675 [Solirubrobacteraceae bacterium]